MATDISKTFTTRQRFRSDIEAGLLRAIAAEVTSVGRLRLQSTEPDGIPVVTSAALDRAMSSLFDQPLPPPSHKAAEVRSDAVVTVWAKCPNCKLHMAIPVSLTPQLVLEGGVGELKLKAKSKGRIHTCGQMSLDEPNGQLTAFASDGISSGEHLVGSDVEDLSDEADEGPLDDVSDARSALKAAVSSLAEPVEDPEGEADAPTPIGKRRRRTLKEPETEIAGEVLEAGEAIAASLPDVDDVLAGDALLPGEPAPAVETCGAAFGADLTCTLPAFHVGDHDDLPF